MPKFHIEAFSDSSRQKVFGLFAGFENYQKLFSQYFPSVRTLSIRNEVSVVEEHLILGQRELVMMTKHIVEGQNKHDVFVIGGDAKGNHIVELFESTKNGTQITINVDFRLRGNMKIANALGRFDVEKEYKNLVEEFLNCLN